MWFGLMRASLGYKQGRPEGGTAVQALAPPRHSGFVRFSPLSLDSVRGWELHRLPPICPRPLHRAWPWQSI